MSAEEVADSRGSSESSNLLKAATGGDERSWAADSDAAVDVTMSAIGSGKNSSSPKDKGEKRDNGDQKHRFAKFRVPLLVSGATLAIVATAFAFVNKRNRDVEAYRKL